MKKLLNLIASIFLVSTATTSVVACSANSHSVNNFLYATVDSNDASRINIIMHEKWDATLFQGIEYQGYKLNNALYSVKWINDKLTIFLNFKVIKGAKLVIFYNNHSYQVNDELVNTTLSENDQKVVEDMNQLQNNGITFVSSTSANEVLPTGAGNLISLTNYIKSNYFANVTNQSDYVIKNFISDSNFFTPIKLNSLKNQPETYTAGSYEFIVYNTKEKQYIGNFPYKVFLKIGAPNINNFNNFISDTSSFENSLGSFNLETFFNILQDLGFDTNSGIYPMIKILSIFGSTIDDIMNNPKLKSLINTLVGNVGYFDLSKILDTSTPAKTIKGTNYYNINSQYQTLVDTIVSNLNINIDNTLTQKINLPKTVGSISITDGVINFTENLRPLIISILPDILHFLNFIHEAYNKGKHNLILLLLQYLTASIPNLTSSTVSPTKTFGYKTDNFCLINQYYDSKGNLHPIIINSQKTDYITDNLENLLYDVLSFKDSNGIYVGWNVAVKGATKAHNEYVYLYNKINNATINEPALLIKGSIKKITYLVHFSDLTFDSSNFNLIYHYTGIAEVYSLRGYIFNSIFTQVFSRKALINPSSSILLTPILSLFTDFSLGKDKILDLKINTSVSIGIWAIGGKRSVNIPLNIDKNITINKKYTDDIVFNAFKNSLFSARDKKSNKLFSNDLVNSLTSFNNMTGDVNLQYKDSNGNWTTVNSNNIANLFNWDTSKSDKAVFVRDFRIEFSNVNFETASTLINENKISLKDKVITLSPDFDLPFF